MGANGGVGGQASRLADRETWAIAAIVVLAAAALWLMGRSPICPCGHVALWHGTVENAENMRQPLDRYGLTRVVEGLIFYAATTAMMRRRPWHTRLVNAIAVEAACEVLETAPVIIARHRAVTMVRGDRDDSILDSLAEIAGMTIGFTLATCLPP